MSAKAIEKALAHPRKIDYNLVDAQQARRVLDRLVGYKLSTLLNHKIDDSNSAGKRSLSGGRVQSVALRLIVVQAAGILEPDRGASGSAEKIRLFQGASRKEGHEKV